MNIGEKIAARRKLMSISQEELDGSLGISRQAVSRWETGDAVPDTEKVIKLSRIFNVTTDYLLLDEIDSCKADGDSPREKRRRKFRIAFGISLVSIGLIMVVMAVVFAGIWALHTTWWNTDLGPFGTGLLQMRVLLLIGAAVFSAGIIVLIREYRR